MFMKYMSTKEASGRWGISDRRIRVLCSEGRIEGAMKRAGNWLIPADAVKPADGRKVIQKTYSGLQYDFGFIDSLKDAIDRYRPFSRRLAASLQEKLIGEMGTPPLLLSMPNARNIMMPWIQHTQ